MKGRIVTLVLGMLSFAFNVHGGIVLPPSDNLLTNPGFASDLSGWNFNSAVIQWSSKDVLGSLSSGSAFITNGLTNGNTQDVYQCVLLSPSSGPFDVGGRFFIPSSQGQRANGVIRIFWYSSSDCSGSELSINELDTPVPTPTDSWTPVASLRITPPAGSVSAFVSLGIGKLDSNTGPAVDGYVDGAFLRPTSCTLADTDLCLHGGRFRVTAAWESPTDGGAGHGIQFNDDSGYFWFFSATNTEVVVKTVSACVDPFNRYWVFAAGLTNVLVTLNVEDTAAGIANHYINPEGTKFVAIQDTQAFDTCP